MRARSLDGAAVHSAIKAELAARVARLRARGIVPGLGSVLSSDDPRERNYVALKHRDAAQIGVASRRVDLPADASEGRLHEAIAALNADPRCSGFLVQLPLPAHLDQFEALNSVDPAKDIDGLHPVNLGRLVLGAPGPLPATPVAIIELLRHYGVALAGAEVCVVGREATLGRPLALLLAREGVDATVTLCHAATPGLAGHTRRAGVVVAAANVPGLVTAGMVAPGAVLVDAGVSWVAGRIVGDMAPDVWDKAAWVTPNPGAVGPMTRAMLLRAVVDAAERADRG